MGVTALRWWVSPPRPDELLSSLLSRAAALYERPPAMLWSSLHEGDSRPWGDVDAPSCAALLRMANALGMRATALHSHRLVDAPWLMVPRARSSYCPQCWNLDLEHNRPHILRRGWSRVLRTKCQIHDQPLLLAQEAWASKSRRLKYPIVQLSANEQGILDLIDRFGTVLEQCLYFGAVWPDGWQSTPHHARSLLVSFTFNMNSVMDFPPIRNVDPGGNLSRLICGPRRFQEPISEPTWDAFRSVANPAFRRAAVWATAWTLIPDLPAAYAPGWFGDLKDRTHLSG